MTQLESGYMAHTCGSRRTGNGCLPVELRALATCAALRYRAQLVRKLTRPNLT